jgi:hypothetical protein
MSKTLQYQCTSFNLIMTNNYHNKNIFVSKIKLHGFRTKFTVWNHNKLYDNFLVSFSFSFTSNSNSNNYPQEMECGNLTERDHKTLFDR